MKLIPVHNKLWETMVKIKMKKSYKRLENVIEMLIEEYNQNNNKKIVVSNEI